MPPTMLVIDASVAVKFVTEEPGSDAAYALLTSAEPLIAPDWVIVESGNAIGRKVRTIDLPRAKAEASFSALPEFFSRLFATEALLSEAFDVALDLSHGLYDCLYLVLAMREDAMLVTADEKFVKTARQGGFGRYVRLLGEEASDD